MPPRKYKRKLPPYIRKDYSEANDFDLNCDYVHICNKCNVYLLNEETAINHIKCIKRLRFLLV